MRATLLVVRLNGLELNAKLKEALTAVAWVSVFGLGAVYFSLSKSPAILPVLLATFSVLEIVRIVQIRRASTELETGFELAFLVAFISTMFVAQKISLVAHPAFLFAFILYRPNFLCYGNRRLAFFLSLLIAIAIVPVACGIATDPITVDLLTGTCSLLVVCLWLFCSSVGGWFFN